MADTPLPAKCTSNYSLNIQQLAGKPAFAGKSPKTSMKTLMWHFSEARFPSSEPDNTVKAATEEAPRNTV